MKAEVALWLIAAAILLATLASCAIPIHSPTATAADRDLIDLAASDLGLRAELVESPVGAIHLDLVDDADPEYAGKRWRLICSPNVVSERDNTVLRHELGHGLGLGHHDSPTNVMAEYAGSDTTELTRKQRRKMRAALLYLRACREAQ